MNWDITFYTGYNPVKVIYRKNEKCLINGSFDKSAESTWIKAIMVLCIVLIGLELYHIPEIFKLRYWCKSACEEKMSACLYKWIIPLDCHVSII